MKTHSNFRLRDVYENCLSSQFQAVRVPVEDERHCWQVKEEQVETRHVYDWLGKDLGTQSMVVDCVRYVWLGSKGAITVTTDRTFHKGGNVKSELPLTLKRWAWKEYFHIDL